MNLAAVRHRNTEQYIYPDGRNKLHISLSAAREDEMDVSLVYWPRYETDRAKRSTLKMHRALRDEYLDHFKAEICTESIAAYTRYCFLLQSGAEQLWLGKNGFTESDEQDNFFEYLWPNPTDSYPGPDWAKEQIYYQIFPERFCNGDSSIDPPDVVSWGTEPDRENFMGGDLRGIIHKLDYIKELGATCLYLTPIFKAPSNHKYDTVDYFDIDPAFGTKQELKELVEAVHERGMRLLLDGVFNHCGYYWPPFQDVVKNGGKSPYASWFFPRSFPVCEERENYDCVGHYKWMPKINLSNAETRDYFILVGRYWIESFGIDGWRLDVADELPTQFLTYFSDAMRKIKPDVLLLGETWADAGRLLAPDRLDSAMNYVFRDAALDWLAKNRISTSRLDYRINRMLSLYPYETVLRLYNLLDSHDTERFRWLCSDKRKHELAVVLQMTLPGCPAIFYGDEVGMEGANDPGCRLAMEWDERRQDKKLLALYKKLISVRKASPSLTKGDYQTLICDDAADVYVFKRTWERETSIVILNAGAQPAYKKVTAHGEWTTLTGDNHVSSEDGELCITALPYSAEIYQRK